MALNLRRPTTVGRNPGGRKLRPKDVAGGGKCPACGKFNACQRSVFMEELGEQVQYRYCDCGHNYKTFAAPRHDDGTI